MFSWVDGSVLTHFGSRGSCPGELWYPRGLRLLCDGVELVVADANNNRLCLFTVTGEFVLTLASKDAGLSAPCDIIEYGTYGGYLAANILTMNLTHVSRDGAVMDVLGNTVTSAIPLNAPLALAALPDGGLVVRAREQLHVFNGRNVRLAWITACLVLPRPLC